MEISLNLQPHNREVYDRKAFIAELATLKEKTDLIMQEAEAFIVDSDESDVQATEIAKRIKLMNKAVEEDKEINWRPYKTAADEISAAYKPLVTSIETAEKTLKGKMLFYRTQKAAIERERINQERKEREDAALAEAQAIMDAAEKNQHAAMEAALKRIAKLREEGKDALADRLHEILASQIGKLVADNAATAEKLLNDAANAKVEKVDLTTRSESGQSYITKTWDFEITDPNLVPREFCTPDAVAIRAAVRGGSREIAGVRIFEKENISIR